MTPETKLPNVGTTIFTVMSQLAIEHGAVNLGQGFPDFDVPARLADALARAMREGKNQYAPMTGIPALRQAIAAKTERCYGVRPDAESDITVVSGPISEALYATALGILVAVEAVIIYNYFNQRLSRINVELKMLVDEFLEQLEEHGPTASRRGKAEDGAADGDREAA